MLATFAVAMVPLLGAPTAAVAGNFAPVHLMIDCYDSDVAASTTNDLITVSYWGYNGIFLGSRTAVPDCNWLEDASFGFYSNYDVGIYDVRSIIVQTHGDDGFWMDELRLQSIYGTVGSWGVDGGLGYCLSTDPNDANGWSGVTTGCHEALRFDLYGSAWVVQPWSIPKRYRVQVDCNDSSVSSAGTSDRVSVSFWNGTTRLGSRHKWGTSCNSSVDDYYDLDTYSDVTHVTVEINGSDAHWMDEVYLRVSYDGSGWFLDTHWGRDGGMGYCLSTDPGDAGGSWSDYVSGCYRALRFYSSGGVYTTSPVF